MQLQLRTNGDDKIKTNKRRDNIGEMVRQMTSWILTIMAISA